MQKRKIASILSVLILLSSHVASAADVAKFIVEVTPTKTSVNQAVDLKIRAVDSNNATVKDYTNTIFMSYHVAFHAAWPQQRKSNDMPYVVGLFILFLVLMVTNANNTLCVWCRYSVGFTRTEALVTRFPSCIWHFTLTVYWATVVINVSHNSTK